LGAAVAVIAVLVGLLLPAVPTIREAASRGNGSHLLPHFVLALRTYHDANNPYPKCPHLDPRASVSRHTLVLPYIE
jgi:hypothetical protein